MLSGAQNSQICMSLSAMSGSVGLRQIGGYRATAAASDHHAARPEFQSASEPSAEYSRPPRRSADRDDGIHIVQFWAACPQRSSLRGDAAVSVGVL
jgi:hypothetical protein